MKQYQAHKKQDTGTLYLVATPIGNLSDISERAVRTLRDVDFIAAEDTRVTRKLTSHLGIKKPLVSYRAHNSRESGEMILARVLSGENCALVSDAGTPSISDPGEDLTRLFSENGVPVVIVPGPCAAVAALALSTLTASRFIFEGFLPAKRSSRLSQLRSLKYEPRTLIFYEAPHKILRTLKDMLEVLGNRRISISREMTKVFEETIRLNTDAAIAHFEANPPRGEFVIVVEGAYDLQESCTEHISDSSLEDGVKTVMELVASGSSKREAIREAARITGCHKNELYKAVMACQPKK